MLRSHVRYVRMLGVVVIVVRTVSYCVRSQGRPTVSGGQIEVGSCRQRQAWCYIVHHRRALLLVAHTLAFCVVCGVACCMVLSVGGGVVVDVQRFGDNIKQFSVFRCDCGSFFLAREARFTAWKWSRQRSR